MKKMLLLTVSVCILMLGLVMADTVVSPGDGTLNAAIKAAASGDVLVLESGGLYTESSDSIFVIDKAVTIKAADEYETRPLVKNISKLTATDSTKADFFVLHNGSSLTLQGIDFDGGEADTSTYRSVNEMFVISPEAGSTIEAVVIDDCHIHHLTGRILNGGTAALSDQGVAMSSFSAENSEFNYAERITSKSDYLIIDNIYIQNCTFWDFTDNVFYLEGGTGELIIDHCTFDNIGNVIRDNDSPDDMIRIRSAVWDTVVVKNCIFSNGELVDSKAEPLQIDTDPKGSVSNVAVYNTRSIKTGDIVATNIYTDDPKYTDAANGDFKLADDSPYLTAGTDGLALGDLRWAPEVVAVDAETLPVDFSLKQNYPNPFNPTTNILYSLPKASNVLLTIYDVSGALVETLVNSNVSAGIHNITWNALNAPSGLYFYQMTIDGISEIRKMTLIR